MSRFARRSRSEGCLSDKASWRKPCSCKWEAVHHRRDKNWTVPRWMRPTYSTAEDPRCAASGRRRGIRSLRIRAAATAFAVQYCQRSLGEGRHGSGIPACGNEPDTRDGDAPISVTATCCRPSTPCTSACPSSQRPMRTKSCASGCNGVMETFSVSIGRQFTGFGDAKRVHVVGVRCCHKQTCSVRGLIAFTTRGRLFRPTACPSDAARCEPC